MMKPCFNFLCRDTPLHSTGFNGTICLWSVLIQEFKAGNVLNTRADVLMTCVAMSNHVKRKQLDEYCHNYWHVTLVPSNGLQSTWFMVCNFMLLPAICYTCTTVKASTAMLPQNVNTLHTYTGFYPCLLKRSFVLFIYILIQSISTYIIVNELFRL